MLRNFDCYSGSARVKGGQLENEDFGERGGYNCESEPIANDSPTDKLNFNAPPRATFSKTNPNGIKEPIFATENSVAVESIGSADSVYY